MKRMLAGAACLLCACQSTDSGLRSANDVLSIARSPSVKTLGSLASAPDRDAALRKLLESRKDAYERTTLLTPDDPRAVDLFSDKPIELTSRKDPYLLGLVQDDQRQPIATPAQAEAFADQLIAKQAKTRQVAVQEGAKQATYVKIPMVANFANKQAEKYRPLVEKFAAQYKVSPSLVYAIIRTESNFNPFAVSSAPPTSTCSSTSSSTPSPTRYRASTA